VPLWLGASVENSDMTGLTILHLLPWLNFGGVEKYVIGLSTALQERGHRCIIVSSGGELLPEAQAARVHHIRMDIHGVRGFGAVRKLAHIIESEHVDLLNAHNWTAGAVGNLAARLAQIPYVFTVHGARDPFQRFFVYYWGPQVVAMSAASRDQLVNGFHLPRERVALSFIGVDTDRFKTNPPAAAVMGEFMLDAEAPKIVHVSRFSRGKAEVALGLVAMAQELERRAPGFQAIIAGVGPLAGEVAARADEANAALGRRAFIFAGGRADVPDLMSVADVAVGTATVALEAMACGKPVVAAGKAGFVGLVTPETFDAANATCFGDHAAAERITPDRLARDIIAMLADPARRRSLGAFGRRVALESFSLRRAAEHIEGVYRDVLGGSRPVRRIAAFHLNQVGDLIFSLPTLEALQSRFPEAEIISILRPNLAELMQASPYIDGMLVRSGGLMAEARLARELRARGFDLAVAFSQSASTVLQALGCGAAKRIGFVDADLSFLLSHKVHLRGLPWPGKLARLAMCLGADAPRTSYVGMLAISPACRERAQRLLGNCGVEDGARIAAIAPGASAGQRHKTWDPDKFAAVAQYLHDACAATVAIVGGPGDEADAARIATAMSAPSIDLAGRTTTGELAAILERCAVIVGIDSGPIHVAAAMGTPVVALFGPTDPARTAPRGEGHEIVTAGLACAPCARPCTARDCMGAISIGQVTAAVDRVFRRLS
jgi:heptosyltransferase-1